MSARILIVDDEPDILQIFRSALVEEGYEVSCASNGAEALKIYGTKPFDLVITDMKMPQMDGLELLKRIKDLDQSSEVIILTGFATLENAIEALKEDRAFDYLTKPLEGLDILYLTINKALERRRLKNENRLLFDQLKEARDELVKKVQEQDLLLDCVETMIWYLTDAETYGAVNEATAKFLGMTKSDLIGKRLAEVLSREQAEQHLAGNREVFKSHKQIRSDEWLKDYRGEARLLTITKTPKLNDQGAIEYVVCSAHDITEYRQMQQELYRVQKLESLGVLAGGIAHDFNNFLGMILGYISLAILDIPTGNQAQESLIEAEKAVLQARDIARQLLTFSEGGSPTKQLIWLSPHLKEVVRFTLSGSNIKSKFHIDDDLWPIECDLKQVEQVVSNLVMNAREAMPEGGTIEVFADNVNLPIAEIGPPQFRKYVRISIKDQGIGISEESLGKIFDPFFSTKQRGSQKGMGLGLALVHSIVNKHNGRITVDSQIGIGTTFHVYLPASQEQVAAPSRAEEAFTVQQTGAGSVLLMDDDDVLRTAVMSML
ncbi:MAG: response regulator, partial [Desulforhabdus sp.]|nr:response regulator [Desulforhabdus sp.]